MFFILYFIGTALFTDTIFNINFPVYIVSSRFYMSQAYALNILLLLLISVFYGSFYQNLYKFHM